MTDAAGGAPARLLWEKGRPGGGGEIQKLEARTTGRWFWTQAGAGVHLQRRPAGDPCGCASRNRKLAIVNASPEVYEIFEMTGFTEMMPVSRAYRRVSVDGCEVIGQGANGKVYRLDPETIIKVYLNPNSLPDIHWERELARKAFVLGIPTAIPYDVVKVGGRIRAPSFELLNAKSFGSLIAAAPGGDGQVCEDVCGPAEEDPRHEGSPRRTCGT